MAIVERVYKMSKVALLLVNQPRFFEKGYQYIKQYILDPYNPDVFMHIWYDKDQIGKPYSAACWNAGQSDVIKPHVKEALLHLYKPIDSIFEPEKFWDSNLPRMSYEPNKGRQYSFITFSQFYSVMCANELKKQHERINNFTYDWVIKIRPDWAIQTLLNIDKMNNEIVYVPNNCPNPLFFNDQFAIGSSKNMDIYSSVFPHLDKYWIDGVQLVGEAMATHNLEVNKVKWAPIPIKHDIIRG
jgi:hypothetical protein